MRDGVRAVMRRAAIATMRRAMASAARPTTNALRCVRTELLDARSETRRWDATRALTGRARAVVVRRARDLEHRPDPRRRR